MIKVTSQEVAYRGFAAFQLWFDAPRRKFSTQSVEPQWSTRTACNRDEGKEHAFVSGTDSAQSE